MELLSVVRMLVRLRWLVALGAVLAVAGGYLAVIKLGGAPTQRSWQVSIQAQVDMPDPLAADSYASSATVQAKTVLMAAYLTRGESAAAIARRAGVPEPQLTVMTPAIDVPRRQSPLVAAAQDTAAAQTPFSVSAVAWPYSPLITLVASAPDEPTATRLSEAAMRELVGGDTGADKDRMVVRQLGPARTASSLTSTPPGAPVGVAVGVFLFGGWCTALVLVSGLLGPPRRLGRETAAGTAA